MIEAFLLRYSNKFVSRWIVLLIDLFLISFSFLFANLIFNTGDVVWFSWAVFFVQLPILLFIYLASFYYFQSFSSVIRHTNVQDAIKIFNAILVATCTLLLLTVLVQKMDQTNSIFNFRLRVVIIHFFFSLFLLVFSRLLIKAGFSYISNIKNKVKASKVVIFGAGQSGLQTLGSLKQNKSLGYKVVGFFDDNLNKVNKTLEGIMVYHSDDLSPDLLHKLEAEVAIIAVQKISNTKKSALIDKFLSANLEVKVVPPAEKWLDGNIDLKQIKNVRIEDLLERDPISLDSEHVKRELLGKTIFITGAAGSIGSEICRQVIQYQPRFIIAFDQAESALYDLEFELNRKGYQGKFKAIIGDVNKTSRVRFLFEKYRPEVVFHAAAYKHVPLMEGNPFEAIWVNVMGTKQIADFAVEFKCEKFVMVSTDKAVNPTNVMGATKRLAEMYTQGLNAQQPHCRFVTTRFGNVLGSNGSVIPVFKKQIENGGPLTVTHEEITRYFMTIPEACELVLEAGAMGRGGEIYVFDMGESVKIIDLARKMIKLSGLRLGVDIEIQVTGLRPGEKLYEELLSNEENTIKTHHPKIMVAKVQDVHFDEIQGGINYITEIHKEATDLELVKVLKTLVPEFISNNSIYEKLDSQGS